MADGRWQKIRGRILLPLQDVPVANGFSRKVRVRGMSSYFRRVFPATVDPISFGQFRQGWLYGAGQKCVGGPVRTWGDDAYPRTGVEN